MRLMASFLWRKTEAMGIEIAVWDLMSHGDTVKSFERFIEKVIDIPFDERLNQNQWNEYPFVDVEEE